MDTPYVGQMADFAPFPPDMVVWVLHLDFGQIAFLPYMWR